MIWKTKNYKGETTRTLSYRCQQHKNRAKHDINRTYLYLSMRKYGIKNWCLVDNVSGMIINMEVYRGGGNDEDTIDKLVLRLLKPYLHLMEKSSLYMV